MSNTTETHVACIYAIPEKRLQKIIESLQINDKDMLHHAMAKESAHCSVFYGPKCYGSKDITEKKEIDAVLGPIVEFFAGPLPRFTIKGVSCFRGEKEFNVVKIDIESPELAVIHKWLKANKEDGYTIYDGCVLHFTLGYIKKLEDEVDDKLHSEAVCYSLEERLKDLNLIGAQFRMTELQFISPVNDIPITIWK